VLRATGLLLAVSNCTAVSDKRCTISTPTAMMLHVFRTRARTGGKFRPGATTSVRCSPTSSHFAVFAVGQSLFQPLRLYVALRAPALCRVCPLYAEGVRGGSFEALRYRSEGRGVRFPIGLLTSSCRTTFLVSTQPLTEMSKANQSHYRPGVAQRVLGS